MQSRYGVTWVRRDGTRVAIEQLGADELREARLTLLREDLEDPVALALFDAVSAELARGRSDDEERKNDNWPMAA